MKSLFNRLAGVVIVAALLYSCASIGRPGVVLLMKLPPASLVVHLCRVRSIIAEKK